MAGGTNVAYFADLRAHPLGSKNGENFSVPSNYVIPPARIYVVNHSRTRPWKRVAVAVSARRGAEEALLYDKKLAQIYNVDTLISRVEKGYDMNRYETSVKPVVFRFKVGQTVYTVPPAKGEHDAPPRIEVKEGAWDIFLGNYDRMRSDDARTKGEEEARLHMHWKYLHNPVYAWDDDSERAELKNEFGFIELVRETQVQTTDTIDKEYLTALDIMEVG